MKLVMLTQVSLPPQRNDCTLAFVDATTASVVSIFHNVAALFCCSAGLATETDKRERFKVGMKLEAVDQRFPYFLCVATVMDRNGMNFVSIAVCVHASTCICISLQLLMFDIMTTVIIIH